MWTQRRTLLTSGAAVSALVAAGALAQTAGATPPQRVAIAVPGPGNLLFLPITLASKLGLDRQHGIELDIRYIGGGPQAFKNMLERNTDFSAGGLSALSLQRLSGKPVVCIVPTTRVPAYTLVVRTALKRKVRSIADLAGLVVGVKGHVPGGRSTSQLFTEYVLKRAGVGPDRVNYVSVGQAYDNQHAALATGTVDAIMGDEPFATRLIGQKVGFALADYHDLDATRKLLGGLFLNGHVATRQDFIDSNSDLVARVVHAIRDTLVWIASHSSADMVDALAPAGVEERAALLEVLRLRKQIYSPDGRFSDEQLASVERFLHATEDSPAARAFRIGEVVNDRWAGRSR